jgi:hypothetical protein
MGKTRPTSVTVFGVLNIIFGAWGLLGIVMLAAVFAITWVAGRHAFPPPPLMLLERHPVALAWTLASIPLGLVATGVLIAAGIGLLKMKPWARTASIVWAIYGIVAGPIGIIVNFVAMSSELADAGHRGGPEAVGAVAGMVGGTIGGCIGLIYPAILLIFMFRRSVVQAFRAAAEAPRA